MTIAGENSINDGGDGRSPLAGRSISKILFLLTRKEKVRLVLLLGALLVNGVIDLLGASSILPFIAVVAKPSMVETNAYLKQAYIWSGAGSVNEFLIYLGVLTLVFALLSNIFALAGAVGHFEIFVWPRLFTFAARLKDVLAAALFLLP